METMFISAAVLLVMGVVFHLTYRAVTQESFVRNRAIGIRTRSTLASDAAWREGHRAAAPLLHATALVSYASAMVCATAALVIGNSVSEALAGVVPLIGFGSVTALLVHMTRVANRAAQSA